MKYRDNMTPDEQQALLAETASADVPNVPPIGHDWPEFTRRTEDPKLTWLMRRCLMEGVRIVQHGESRHAPITRVHPDDLEKAWGILTPRLDNMRDDASRFRNAPDGWDEFVASAEGQSLGYFNRYIAGDR